MNSEFHVAGTTIFNRMKYNDQIYWNIIVLFVKWCHSTRYEKTPITPVKVIHVNNGDTTRAAYVTQNISTLEIYSNRLSFCKSAKVSVNIHKKQNKKKDQLSIFIKFRIIWWFLFVFTYQLGNVKGKCMGLVLITINFSWKSRSLEKPWIKQLMFDKSTKTTFTLLFFIRLLSWLNYHCNLEIFEIPLK